MKLPLKFSLFLAVTSQAWALTLPSVFTDHMVLQRGQKVPVWGTADPDASVTVSFAGQSVAAKSDAQGKWRVDLAPLKANKTPAQLTVKSGEKQSVIKDVLVGEVWLCSGQSNMQWAMRRSENPKQSIAAANFPLIRLYHVPQVASEVPLDKINAKWKVCNPSNVENFSAVAYYFGRKLHQDLDVPVGLINSSWGGTRIEPWTPPCGFEGIKAVADIHKTLQNARPGSPFYKKSMEAYLTSVEKWKELARKSLAVGDAVPAPPAFPPKGTTIGKSQKVPTALYNGMIHALVPFAIKGAIWYQGESNHREGALYTEKTKALVQGWRKLWGYDLPYYFVQIAPYHYRKESPEILPKFWEAQAKIVEEIPKTGMAIVSDHSTVNNIHPPNKFIPGSRLALLALANDYGKNVVSKGPVFKDLEKQGDSLKINFDSAKGLKTRDGKAPDWFEVAGQDGVYKKATAVIQGESVIVKSDEVPAPSAVRFAWHKLAEPNLVNGAGLPCSAFRADKVAVAGKAKSTDAR